MMDEKRDPKALRVQHIQTVQTLRDVSGEIRKSLSLRTGFEVSGELARVLRVEMAKAGRVLVHLVSAGDLQKPEHFQPWLSIALGFASLPREKVFEEVGCTISLPASMGEVDASTDDDLWAAATMFAQQDGCGGQDLDDHVVAALNRFVNRHAFLEAVASWLPVQIGLAPQDLSLLKWTIQPAAPNDRPATKLVSDWHERCPPFSQYSGGADIASSCATACDSLCHKILATRDDAGIDDAVRDVKLGDHGEVRHIDHAKDFTWLKVGAERYEFATGNQAATIGALFEAWSRGGDGAGLSEETIKNSIGSGDENFRVRMTFRGHKALETILCSIRKGQFALFLSKTDE